MPALQSLQQSADEQVVDTRDSIECCELAPSTTNVSGVDRWCRNLVRRKLAELRFGCVIVEDHDGSQQFGDRAGSLRAKVIVHSPRFYRRLVFGGQLGSADAYLAREWTCDDLVTLIRIFGQNAETPSTLERGATRAFRPLRSLYHRLRRNTVAGSKRNISDHYDLGNEFFSLFLDESMTYSSAIFDVPDASLNEAQLAKYDRACRKLSLQADDHVVEIGTGWGGFAIYAAETYGCRVTTTTISREQHLFAKQRVEEAGLGDRITLLEEDYRTLKGEYDKLVSIEMIEAVGHEFLPVYFKTCSRLLKPTGMMLLQAITIQDQMYDDYRRSIDFIQRYIFPGGCLPSISAICQATARSTNLRLVDSTDFGLDYARTLSMWSERFEANLDEIRRLGADDEFVRKWRYYFAYCEGAFREYFIGVSQLLLAKPQASPALP